VTPGFRKEELPPGEEEIYPTFMPDYGLSDEQARALTIYMLSLTDRSLPSKYVTAPAPAEPEPEYASSVDHGRAVFHQYGCNGCHGTNAMGGRKNWNAQLGQEVPSLVYVKAYYDRDTLKEFIRAGRQPVPRLDTRRPRPPLYMPSWKDRLSEEELDALADYLLSLYEQVPGAPAQPQTAEGGV
jgi:mono/diheme cytochrome c family protein